MVRRLAPLLMLLLALSAAGPARGEGPLLGTVVEVDPAEARLVLRVDSDGSERQEITLKLGEGNAGEWPRAGQLVRVWLVEGSTAGAMPVTRSIMAVGGSARDPTGVRARIGRDAAGRPPGGGRHGR